jgi:hypothetical protein
LAFVDIATIPFSIVGSHPLMAASPTAFFVGDPGDFSTDAWVRRLSDAGDLGATLYTLTDNKAIGTMAVNTAETILYFAPSYTSSQIKRWDLTLNAAMADFLADVAGYHVAAEIIVLADDTFLTAYVKDDGTDNYIKRFSPDGTLLNTYAFGADYIGSLVAGVDDALTFWVWQLPVGTTGVSRFSQIQVSDGTVLVTFDTEQFQVGVNQADEAASMDRFGGDASGCSSFGILVLPGASSVCVTAPPSASCWSAHDIDVLQIGLNEEGLP